MRAQGLVIALSILGTGVGCGGDDGGGWHTVGECEPPADGTAVSSQVTTYDPFDACFATTGDLQLVGSQAEWDALFDCGTPEPVPAGLDFATARAAVIEIMCTPSSFTFASDRASEVVVGIHTGVSGACLGTVIVVPLPQSAKPVRLAQCADVCDDCPPVP
jgi:hypothetical protein